MMNRYTLIPDHIKEECYLDDVLERLRNYEKETGFLDVGVLAMLNRSIGIVCMIYSFERSQKYHKSTDVEPALKFYPKQYFLDLKEKFTR